jgi:hypothetical protein
VEKEDNKEEEKSMFRTESGDIFETTSATDWEFGLLHGSSHVPASHCEQDHNLLLSSDEARLYDEHHHHHHFVDDGMIDDRVDCSAEALQFSDHITRPFVSLGKRDSLSDMIENLDRGATEDDMFDLRFPVEVDDMRSDEQPEELEPFGMLGGAQENADDSETIDQDVLSRAADPIHLSDDEESQDWMFVPANGVPGVPEDCIQEMKFLLKSKREQLWRANMLPRMFLTSRYVLRMSFKFLSNFVNAKKACLPVDDDEEDPVIVRLRLVNADSLNGIQNGIHCPNGFGLLKKETDERDKNKKECDISFKCRTNSHFHGNAFFR